MTEPKAYQCPAGCKRKSMMALDREGRRCFAHDFGYETQETVERRRLAQLTEGI